MEDEIKLNLQNKKSDLITKQFGTIWGLLDEDETFVIVWFGEAEDDFSSWSTKLGVKQLDYLIKYFTEFKNRLNDNNN